MTHDASSSPADSDPWRCGRMTLATLVSRICMKATTITVRVIAHLRAGEIGAASTPLFRLEPHVLQRSRPRVGVDQHQRRLRDARPDRARPAALPERPEPDALVEQL